MNERDDFVIGHFTAGAVDDEELNRLIADAWSEAIVDPADDQEIAGQIQTAADRGRPSSPQPTEISGRPGRTRTCNQTVMSKAVSPEKPDKSDS